MEEYTVFERMFNQDQNVDSMFVRLTCNEDNELKYVSVKSITMTEQLGLASPSMVIDFVDGSGDFVNNNRLNTEAIYTLYFGRELLEADETKFKIVDIQHGNGVQGRSKGTSFKVFFAHQHWEELSAVKKNRGWSLKKYSDVVDEVISEKGFSEVTIEESFRTIENIVQMNKTDSSLLEQIRQIATPKSRDGHYVFCGRLDNKFFFQSTYELIKRGMEIHKKKKMPLLRLGGQPPRVSREKQYDNNANTPISFTGFGASERYAQHVANGVTNIESGYYDWNNRIYVRRNKSLSDINATQLSEWSLVRDSTTFTSKKVFGGRNGVVVGKTINTLSEMSSSMQDVYINIEGQMSMHCGDIVEVIIPSSEDDQVPYNEMYSGFYMIKKITNLMTLGASTDFVSQLILSRNGMDSKTMKGYVKSKKGRVSV